jgi:hypothetical protein
LKKPKTYKIETGARHAQLRGSRILCPRRNAQDRRAAKRKAFLRSRTKSFPPGEQKISKERVETEGQKRQKGDRPKV